MNIRLKKIEDVNFYINKEFDKEKLDETLLGISIYNNAEFADNEVVFTLETKYVYNKEKETLLSQRIKLYFITKNKTDIDSNDMKNLLLQFQSIGIGTIRGFIANKTKDTYLKEYPLPLIETSLLENKIKEAIDSNSSNKQKK